MKYKVLLIVLLACATTLKSQMAVTRSVTTVLEKYENKWQHWGGDAETIRFAAVKYISEQDSNVTMQIRVTNKDWEKTSMSTGGAFGGGNSWAVGFSQTQTIQKRVGLIVLTKAEATALYDFENEMYVRSNADGPANETTWSMIFGERFVVSVTYNGKWKHTWTIDDASFDIPDFEVIPMFKKLRSVLNLM
jgi:hypothetical protein